MGQNNQDQFLEYYSNNFPDFILAVGTRNYDSIKIIVDTQYLFDEIAPALGKYLQEKIASTNNQITQ